MKKHTCSISKHDGGLKTSRFYREGKLTQVVASFNVKHLKLLRGRWYRKTLTFKKPPIEWAMQYDGFASKYL